jgi:hypothetical protein
MNELPQPFTPHPSPMVSMSLVPTNKIDLNIKLSQKASSTQENNRLQPTTTKKGHVTACDLAIDG